MNQDAYPKDFVNAQEVSQIIGKIHQREENGRSAGLVEDYLMQSFAVTMEDTGSYPLSLSLNTLST